jgi:hypothetical protein
MDGNHVFLWGISKDNFSNEDEWSLDPADLRLPLATRDGPPGLSQGRTLPFTLPMHLRLRRRNTFNHQ